jgi:nicotinic acetylcholine receptor, invertebrate
MFRSLFFIFLLNKSINLCYCNLNDSINHEYNENMDEYNENMDEYQLREQLFTNYSINNIPIINSSDTIILKYGIQIESLEYFNQVSENIKFNTFIIQEWTDKLLNWNQNNHNNHSHSLDYITLLSSQVWKPDLELYNAAERPVIFDTTGGLKLYNNGTIYYSRPTKYSFSCKLDLKKFPFDTQNCDMTFGSWKYSKSTLDLKPFNETDLIKNISVSDSFSHNEWNIVNVSVVHEDIEYLCCPGDYYPNSVFTISLKRNPQKYIIVIIMTIFITISDFFVSFISADKYKRTFILVFIPLTLLWLQIYIASKIPVIAYSTLMEDILLASFIITILNAFESALLYVIINLSKNKIIPYKKTIYNKNITKLNIISYFGEKYYELNLKNKLINNLHNFDNFYRAFMILFFSIYVGVLIGDS